MSMWTQAGGQGNVHACPHGVGGWSKMLKILSTWFVNDPIPHEYFLKQQCLDDSLIGPKLDIFKAQQQILRITLSALILAWDHEIVKNLFKHSNGNLLGFYGLYSTTLIRCILIIYNVRFSTWRCKRTTNLWRIT